MKNIYNSLNKQHRERTVHFHPDVSNSDLNRRSPLEKLELVKNAVTNGILSNHSITLEIKPENKIGSASRSRTKARSIFKSPASNANEAKQFAMCIKLISLLIENLSRNQITTKRDLYYQDVSLFENQSNVDKLINAICQALGFTNFDLGAVATQKGLCFGNMELHDTSYKSFDTNDGCFLIPRVSSKTRIRIDPSIIDYILVVEKDAIFQLLCDPSQISNKIIITGKGFPDNNTKKFLNLLSSQYPRIPVYGLADIDPHGLNIMKQFKTGGESNNCFMVHNDENFHCHRLKLLNLLENNHFTKTFDCLDFSLIDYQLSFKLIDQKFDEFDPLENQNFMNQLQRTMFFGKKAEIDMIQSIDGNGKVNMIEFINQKISTS